MFPACPVTVVGMESVTYDGGKLAFEMFEVGYISDKGYTLSHNPVLHITRCHSVLPTLIPPFYTHVHTSTIPKTGAH